MQQAFLFLLHYKPQIRFAGINLRICGLIFLPGIL